ncbi:MAG: hypothetical protein LBH55_03555 [Mycoplasmataceae bacterium]|jgi:hypothetical protein|nr:hypothetical protein [Mycoplasmataceae bacterium]
MIDIVFEIQTNDENKFSLGFPESLKVGDINKIEKFINIKYVGIKDGNDELTGKEYKYHQVDFLYNDKDFKEFLLNKLNEQENNEVSLSEILEDMGKLLANYIKEKDVEKIIGDLGEAYFLFLLEKNDIDWTKYYHIDDEEIYDFTINSLTYIDIKTSTNNKNLVHINLEQIKNVTNKNINFIIIKVNKIRGKNTIIDILAKLKYKNNFINSMIKKYSSEEAKKIIELYTLDLDEEIYILDDKLIPIIDINNKGALVKAKFEISTANASICTDQKLKEIFIPKNSKA